MGSNKCTLFQKSKNPSVGALRSSIQLNRRKLRRNIYMHKHTSKSELKVDGKMSEKGADRAGLLQAITNFGLVVGLIVIAIILALK